CSTSAPPRDIRTRASRMRILKGGPRARPLCRQAPHVTKRGAGTIAASAPRQISLHRFVLWMRNGGRVEGDRGLRQGPAGQRRAGVEGDERLGEDDALEVRRRAEGGL